MKRLVIVVSALAALAPALAPAAAPHARVWLGDSSPLTVRGSGFKPGERVAVKLTAGRRYASHSVSATQAGTLETTWTAGAATKAGCVTVVITARGNRGSVATYKAAARECAEPAQAGE